MELHHAQLSTLIFLESVKVYSKRSEYSLKWQFKLNYSSVCRGYIQQADNEVTCFVAEAICLDVTS